MASFFAQHFPRHRCTTYKKRDSCEGDSSCLWIKHPRDARFKHKLKKFFNPSLDVDLEGRCQSKRPSNAAPRADRNLYSDTAHHSPSRSQSSRTTPIVEGPLLHGSSKNDYETLESIRTPYDMQNHGSPSLQPSVNRHYDNVDSEPDLESTSPSSNLSVAPIHEANRYPSGHHNGQLDLSIGVARGRSSSPFTNGRGGHKQSPSPERRHERPSELPTTSPAALDNPTQSAFSTRGSLVKKMGGLWEKQIAEHGISKPQKISAEAERRREQAAEKQAKLERERRHAEQKKKEATQNASESESDDSMDEKEFSNLSVAERRRIAQQRLEQGGARFPKQ